MGEVRRSEGGKRDSVLWIRVDLVASRPCRSGLTPGWAFLNRLREAPREDSSKWEFLFRSVTDRVEQIHSLVAKPSFTRLFVCDGLPEQCVVIVIGENPLTRLGTDWWSF